VQFNINITLCAGPFQLESLNFAVSQLLFPSIFLSMSEMTYIDGLSFMNHQSPRQLLKRKSPWTAILEDSSTEILI